MDSTKIMKSAVYTMVGVLVFLCLLAFVGQYCMRTGRIQVRRYRRNGRGIPHKYNPTFQAHPTSYVPQMERIDENV